MMSSSETPGEKGTHFPTVYWPQWKCCASFHEEDGLPDVDPSSLYAVLGFVFYGEQIVLADIQGRGYCIPSGKIESGENPENAMIREAYEEIGAILNPDLMKPIGWYSLTKFDAAEQGPIRICPVFIAQIDSLSRIPDGSESQGVRLATIGEIPELYFFWDELMAAVFHRAAQVRMALWEPLV